MSKAKYFGVVGNRDYIKLHEEQLPFWHFLDNQPYGWLISLAYMRSDLPCDASAIRMFDCGAWTYRNEPVPKLGSDSVTPEWAFEQYRRVALPGDFIIAPDHMLIPGVDLDARRLFNEQSAARFLKLANDSPFCPMAPVHGESLQERIDTARWLVDGGYTALALGGLAARASQKSLILEAVEAIRKAISPDVWVHVLGLSSPEYAAAWRRMGIQSFDGASHFRQAFTAGVFFALGDDGRLKKHFAARPGEDTKVPQCDCHACSLLRAEGIDTRCYGSNESNMGRAAHNMNMLMRAQQVAMADATILVSCVGQKLDRPAPAASLYRSDWFRKARVYAEMHGDRWYVLSAKHGLLSPDETVEPYDATLNTMSVEERRTWGCRTLQQIMENVPIGRVEMLAGQRYREHLIDPMRKSGYTVVVPMEGLGIGQQLAWMLARTARQLELWGNDGDKATGADRRSLSLPKLRT